MSVLIKGINMPTNCVDCRFHKGIYCTLTDICTNTAQRCPLVEIPPHGRLIDADAAKAHFKDEGMRVSKLTVMAVLNNAQTIIEEEVSE